MKALVDEEIEGKEDLSVERMTAIVQELRESLQAGKRPFPEERSADELVPEN